MRYLFTFLLVFFSSLLAVAQTNLVPNPSFEDFITCPSAFDQLDRVTNWSSFGGSPDYINECANAGGSSVGVPQNTWGFQYAKDGKGYLFFGTYDIQSLPNNTREYVGVQLTQPLTIGNRYFVSAFVSRADSNYANGATNNIGFRFTDQSYSKLMPFVPDNFAQINCDTIIYDQQNWVQLFGSFVSDTAFQYLIIGNFFDNLHTDTSGFNYFGGGYYIDAVCVSTDSTYTKNWTGILKPEKDDINFIFSDGNLYFLNIQHPTVINVFDSVGRSVFEGTLDQDHNVIRIKELRAGIYFLKALGRHTLKLFINN